jgi:uncharacterized protein (TIGR00369 family)
VSGRALDAAQITAFLEELAPGVTASMAVEDVGDRTARVRLRAGPDHLRPGGIVAGPALVSLADMAVWVAVLGVIGPVAMAVTSSLAMHFLRPVTPGAVVADARLHKVGRRLATGEVLLYADGDPEPVALATITYSIPADR